MKHSTWMGIAKLIAENESKCISHKVGAVIVKNDRIVSTGYNGNVSGLPNCCDVNKHLVFDGKFQEFVSQEAKDAHHSYSLLHEIHAEMNALLYASAEDRKGAILYSTLQPCYTCSLLICGSGIKTVIYDIEYHRTSTESIKLLIDSGIEVYKLSDL